MEIWPVALFLSAYFCVKKSKQEIPLPPIPLRNPRRFSLQCLEEADDPMKNVLAIYPGTFDPVTNGHLDLIERGAKIFARLTVSILRNLDKDPLFTLDERVEMLREVTKPWPNVEVDVFSGLLVEYAQLRDANVILRGIRAVSDYEYELQMAMMNRKLNPNIETVFMMPAVAYSYLSSRLVREIAHLWASITSFVPPLGEERLPPKILYLHPPKPPPQNSA